MAVLRVVLRGLLRFVSTGTAWNHSALAAESWDRHWAAHACLPLCSLQLLLWGNGAVSSRQRLSSSRAAVAAGLGDKLSGNQEYVVLGSAQSPRVQHSHHGDCDLLR